MRFSVVGDVTGIRPVLTTAVSFAIAMKFIGFICVASGFEVGSDLTVIADHSLCFPSVGQVPPVKQGQASALTNSGSCPSQKFELVMFPLGVGISLLRILPDKHQSRYLFDTRRSL